MATPHISAAPGDFADTVLLPGDPLRAEYIAENFLEGREISPEVQVALFAREPFMPAAWEIKLAIAGSRPAARKSSRISDLVRIFMS